MRTGNFNGCKRHGYQKEKSTRCDTPSGALLLLIPLQTHLRVSAVPTGAFLHVCLHQVAFAMDITHVLPAPASPRRKASPAAARGLTPPTPHFGLAAETSVPTLF